MGALDHLIMRESKHIVSLLQYSSSFNQQSQSKVNSLLSSIQLSLSSSSVSSLNKLSSRVFDAYADNRIIMTSSAGMGSHVDSSTEMGVSEVGLSETFS